MFVPDADFPQAPARTAGLNPAETVMAATIAMVTLGLSAGAALYGMTMALSAAPLTRR